MDEQGAWHLSLPLLGIDRIDSPKQWVRTVWVLKFKVLFSKLPSINSPSSFVPRVLPLLQLQAAGILAGFRAFLPSGGLLLGSVHGSEHQKFQTPSTEWSTTVARSSQQRSLCHPKRCWERGVWSPQAHRDLSPGLCHPQLRFKSSLSTARSILQDLGLEGEPKQSKISTIDWHLKAPASKEGGETSLSSICYWITQTSLWQAVENPQRNPSSSILIQG